MVDKIEMSLDDIIKSTKRPGGGAGGRGGKGGFRRNNGQKGQQGGRVGGGGAAAGRPGRRPGAGNSAGGILKGRTFGGIQKAKFTRSRGDVNSAWKHDLYDGPRRGAGGLLNKSTAKLLVSNLDYGVSESDIRELFGEFGTLKNASVHYDKSGRSLGTADVIFDRRSDAVKAMKQYNGVPLDGRPMNIQVATSELPTLRKTGPVGGAVGGRPNNRNFSNNKSPNRPGQRRGTAPRRQGGAGGGVGNRLKGNKTAEELDAELDAYVNDMKI